VAQWICVRAAASIQVQGAPEYDGRMLRLLSWVQPSLPNVQAMLAARSDGAAYEKGLSPTERAANLTVTSDGQSLRPDTIILVDDVVTSGSHFKAAALVLRHIYGPRKIVGLFLARTARQTTEPREDGASECASGGLDVSIRQPS
jgi:hypothetical protein